MIKILKYFLVNEEGTEAAAATAAVFLEDSLTIEPEPKTFKADRPFIFLIREHATGMILFSGRVVDPIKQ